jgi:opine dehydrogenase
LYNRTDDKLNAVRWHGGITISGEVEGFGKVECATSSMKEALKGADVLMVVTPATAHEFIAGKAAPFLTDGQIVILNPGRTCGALEFKRVLTKQGNTRNVIIAEAQTFIYAARALSQNEAKIFRIKNSVPLASLPAHWIPGVLKVIKRAFPQFIAGSNVLATSLDNIGAVFHPALTIMNAGWIESTRGAFDYYIDGVTPAVAKILEQIDSERVDVASALGIRVVTAREWLYLTYDSAGKDLYTAIQNTRSYKGIRAPSTVNHRYIFEDVPMSLVPIASLGDMLGVPVPAIRQMIRLGSLMLGADYERTGRTVKKLGIAGWSVKKIRQMAVGTR